MKHTAFVALIVTTFVCAGIASAEDSPKISLNLPAGFVQSICKSPVWNGTRAIWGGVADKRVSQEVGLQTQKGKDAIPVMSNPPVDKAFDSALKEVFTACGMKFVQGENGDVLNISAEIKDFYTGMQKSLVTGKSEAKSSLAFTMRRGNRSMSVTVGYEIESKKIRSGNIKQLSETISELFRETIRQVTVADEMRDLR